MLPPPYVGSYGEERLLQEKDMAGFYYVARLLRDQDRNDTFVYVGLGRSPVVLMEFMRKVFTSPAYDLPLSITTTPEDYERGWRDVDCDETMRNFLDEYLPIDLDQKTIVLIDYVDSGYSLSSAERLLKKYVKQKGFKTDIMIAPLTEIKEFLEKKTSLLKGFDPDTSASHRLLKVLKGVIDKDNLTAYPRITEEHIQSNKRIIKDDKVERRLQLVLEAAVVHMTGNGVKDLIQQLEDSTYYQPRKNPGRDLKTVFAAMPSNINRPRSTVEKEHLLQKYRTKSAKEYGIPESQFSYQTLRAITWTRKHPRESGAVGAIIFAFICYLFVTIFLGSGQSHG